MSVFSESDSAAYPVVIVVDVVLAVKVLGLLGELMMLVVESCGYSAD